MMLIMGIGLFLLRLCFFLMFICFLFSPITQYCNVNFLELNIDQLICGIF